MMEIRNGTYRYCRRGWRLIRANPLGTLQLFPLDYSTMASACAKKDGGRASPSFFAAFVLTTSLNLLG